MYHLIETKELIYRKMPTFTHCVPSHFPTRSVRQVPHNSRKCTDAARCRAVAFAVIVSADRYYLEIQYNVYYDIPAFRFPVGTRCIYYNVRHVGVRCNRASCRAQT